MSESKFPFDNLLLGQEIKDNIQSLWDPIYDVFIREYGLIQWIKSNKSELWVFDWFIWASSFSIKSRRLKTMQLFQISNHTRLDLSSIKNHSWEEIIEVRNFGYSALLCGNPAKVK